MNFRNNLTGTVFVSLLIWGPIDHTWPAWLFIRIGYLVLIPFLVWLILNGLWRRFDPSKQIESALDRILFGLIGTALVILGLFEATSNEHIGNTKWMRTRDGVEAVGEDVVLPGPDWIVVLMTISIGLIVFWYGSLKQRKV